MTINGTTEDGTANETTTATSTNEIWIEKHRPSTLTEVVGQENITDQLEGYVEQGEIPNLLFAGRAGIGKTTSAIALAKDLYGDDWENNFLELNASDDRGIDVVRERVKEFARASYGTYDYRIIFLDEADSLTDPAQAALRRTMEQFSNNIRFILSCNFSNQIIDPIQSRCSVQRFSEIGDEDVKKRLEQIASYEDLNATDGAYEAIISSSSGDMRQAVNTLQSASVSADEITEDVVYRITSTPRPEAITDLVNSAVNGDFYESREQLDDLLGDMGLAGSDILEQIHRNVWEFDVEESKAVDIMQLVGDVDYRLTQGANERIQLEALLAEFDDLG